MDVEQITHYAEWLIGAFLTVVFGLQYSIEVDLVDVIFTSDSTALAIFGLAAVVVGGASLYRLVTTVMGEF